MSPISSRRERMTSHVSDLPAAGFCRAKLSKYLSRRISSSVFRANREDLSNAITFNYYCPSLKSCLERLQVLRVRQTRWAWLQRGWHTYKIASSGLLYVACALSACDFLSAELWSFPARRLIPLSVILFSNAGPCPLINFVCEFSAGARACDLQRERETFFILGRRRDVLWAAREIWIVGRNPWRKCRSPDDRG
jgi:hypothetical protein